MKPEDIDRDRVHQYPRADQRAHAMLLDLEDRIREIREAAGRKETGLALRRKEERDRPQYHYPGVQTGNAIAELERDLARDREELGRLVAERDALSEVWAERKRLSTKVQAFARRHLPAGTFDGAATSTITVGGDR